jgi:hypothetical protein
LKRGGSYEHTLGDQLVDLGKHFQLHVDTLLLLVYLHHICPLQSDAVSDLYLKGVDGRTYISSYFMVDGGFFLVDRWISEESFKSSLTLISAENTERIILVSEVSRGSIGGADTGRETDCF